MAMYTSRNPLAALLDYATNRGNEAASIGSVMSQLANPILKSQGVQVDDAVQRGPVPKPTLVSTAPPVPPVPVVPLPKTTSDAEEYYIREYQKRGLARPVAEGIVASMNSESGLDPTINEKNPVVAGSRGGFGLAQWTGPRRIAFERWASDHGKDVNDAQAQVDFTMSEFAGPERKAYDALIQSPDAQSAAATFTNQFLRPGVPNMEARVNDAARMSGQPYNPAIAASAGPTAAGIGIGGPMPQTVEGILSTLYPDGSADEKKAHRKDILMGLSQGLSALSQGRPVDLSNIAANAEQRRRQNVLDMRERERSRAGAALIYSQTGDADMAGAVASGVMSINDVFSERERKRIAEQADTQRLKAEQANKALGGLVLGMAGDLGFSQSQVKDVATALDNGVDPNSVLTLGQQAKVAEKARIDQHDKEVAAEKRDAAVEHFGQSQNPIEKTAASYMALNPDMSWADALKAAQDANKTSAGGDKGYEFQAQIQARMDNLGEDKATATRAVLEQQKAAGASVTVAPDGTISIVPPAGAPAGTGTPTAAAPGVGGAFGSIFGSVNDAAKAALLPGDIQQQAADLTATTQQTAIEAAKAPVDLQTAQADLVTKLQDIEAKKKAAPTVEAQAALDVEGKDLANQQAALNLQLAKSGQYVDAQTKQAALAAAELQVKTAKKAYDEAVATSEQAKVDAQKQSSDSYINADKQFAVFEDSAKEVMAHGLDAMTTGLLGQVVGKVGGYVVDQTPRSDFLAKVGTMGSQLMLGALSDLKAAGVALTPVTDTDLQVAGKSATLLADPSKLSGETIVKETAFQTNYMKDALYGPKDLTRYDDYGQPYKVGQSTLGVTEDTFARHWMSVPPAIKEAWRAGKITALPTDDPNYAEAAKVINTLESNFKLYQPDEVLDRSIVGIPAPEGVPTEDWPTIWASLSDKAKAELTKAAK